MLFPSSYQCPRLQLEQLRQAAAPGLGRVLAIWMPCQEPISRQTFRIFPTCHQWALPTCRMWPCCHRHRALLRIGVNGQQPTVNGQTLLVIQLPMLWPDTYCSRFSSITYKVVTIFNLNNTPSIITYVAPSIGTIQGCVDAQFGKWIFYLRPMGCEMTRRWPYRWAPLPWLAPRARWFWTRGLRGTAAAVSPGEKPAVMGATSFSLRDVRDLFTTHLYNIHKLFKKHFTKI
jgi:hypothetical protein